MTTVFRFYSSKVCKSDSGVQEYRIVMKSIVKAMLQLKDLRVGQ